MWAAGKCARTARTSGRIMTRLPTPQSFASTIRRGSTGVRSPASQSTASTARSTCTSGMPISRSSSFFSSSCALASISR
jgi:hypothetical protein